MDACSLRSEPLSVTIKDASSHCDKTHSPKAMGRKIIAINTDQNETVQSPQNDEVLYKLTHVWNPKIQLQQAEWQWRVGRRTLFNEY